MFNGIFNKFYYIAFISIIVILFTFITCNRHNPIIETSLNQEISQIMGNSSSSSSSSSSKDKQRQQQQQNSEKKRDKMNSVAPLIIQASTKQTASLIFLHGLGDTGHGWYDAFREIKKPNVKYIFPTAPVRPVTLNGGMRMTAWFDIIGLNPGEKQDEDGLKQSRQILLDLVETEIQSGIPSERIIIGGFSQGGATALYTTLTAPHRFGGVLALSTWLPCHEKAAALLDRTQPDKLKTPIIQCHGDFDPLIPLPWSQASVKLLESLGFSSVKYKVYRGLMHSSSEEEMDDVNDFIADIVKN